jgi:RND family efflux transporter MFP subunit
MKLVPLDASKFTGEVKIDPVVVQNIGVRVKPVSTGPLVKTIRTVGNVDYAEPLLSDVSPKVGGWIEKLYVNETGQQVTAGDKLFDLYSPELYAAQEEYLLAYRNQGKVGADFVPDAAKNNKALLDSARTKLQYFDITPAQIKALERAGKPSKTMTILAPRGGVVIEKHAFAGMKIDAGMLVFRIADLSKVWVMATVYEYQLPYVQVGQQAVMTLSYLPGEKFEGKVVYVYPYLNEKTRQAKVRLEVANPHGLLKPGMFASVELKNELAKDRVLAPRSAIIDTGTRSVAFVSLGNGRFEPRNVRTGVETEDGKVEILDGLKPGEMVVTSGQFLIDSEARMREALAKMVKGDLASNQNPTAAVAGASELKSLPADLQAQLVQVLDGYFAIGNQLASDSSTGIATSARRIADSVDHMLAISIPQHPHFWHDHDEIAVVRGKALELIGAASLEEVRLKYADLSVALGKLLGATGIPPSFGNEVDELHCPMYLEGQGGSTWLQLPGTVRNPFFGGKMPNCFDRRQALPVTGKSANSSVSATQPVAANPTLEQ